MINARSLGDERKPTPDVAFGSRYLTVLRIDEASRHVCGASVRHVNVQFIGMYCNVQIYLTLWGRICAAFFGGMWAQKIAAQSIPWDHIYCIRFLK